MSKEQMTLNVNDVFLNVGRPQREWRVTQRNGDLVVLERIDPPGAMRFVSVGELLDNGRYVPKDQGGAPRTWE